MPTISRLDDLPDPVPADVERQWSEVHAHSDYEPGRRQRVFLSEGRTWSTVLPSL